jgi:Putative lumazine-binding
MPNSINIRAAMTLYFDGIYHSDVALLAQVFHPDAIYVCATKSPLVYKTMEEYFAIVANREAPASRGEARVDEIVSIDLAGENTAFVKAHCAIGSKYFTDFLTFIRVDGRWQIISKVFHYEVHA